MSFQIEKEIIEIVNKIISKIRKENLSVQISFIFLFFKIKNNESLSQWVVVVTGDSSVTCSLLLLFLLLFLLLLLLLLYHFSARHLDCCFLIVLSFLSFFNVFFIIFFSVFPFFLFLPNQYLFYIMFYFKIP